MKRDNKKGTPPPNSKDKVLVCRHALATKSTTKAKKKKKKKRALKWGKQKEGLKQDKAIPTQKRARYAHMSRKEDGLKINMKGTTPINKQLACGGLEEEQGG